MIISQSCSMLIINFVGTVNELKPSCLQGLNEVEKGTEHIAPSLMMSGSYSKPTEKVARSLERRYYVNMLGNLFLEPYKTTFSLTDIYNLATLGRKRIIDSFIHSDKNYLLFGNI